MRISALFFLLAVGCQGFGRADEDAIGKAGSDWHDAVIERDFKRVAGLYADDAVLFPPEMEPVVGRAAIEKYFEAFPEIETLVMRTVELEGRGDLAFLRGDYVMRIAGTQVQGAYLEIWRKQDDGSWKLWRDTYNTDEPDDHK